MVTIMYAARLRRVDVVSLAVLAASSPFGASMAAAQTSVPDPSRAIQQSQSGQLQEERERRRQQLNLPPLAPLSSTARLNECSKGAGWRINQIIVTGAGSIHASKVQSLADKYKGRLTDCDNLTKLRAEVYELYDQAGQTLTQVLIDKDSDPRRGILRLVIVEAKVGAIGFCRNWKRRAGGGNAFPIEEGQALTLEQLDQGIENIDLLTTYRLGRPQAPKNPPELGDTEIDCGHDQGSTVTIKPGDADGEGVITVQMYQKRPFYATAGADNLGGRSTGKTRINASLGLEDIFGGYERLELSGSHTTRGGIARARNLAADFNVPIGYWRVSLSGSYFDYRSRFTAGTQPFITSGDQSFYAFDVNRVVGRSQFDRWSVGAGLAIKDTNNFINDLKLATSSRQLTLLNVRASYDTRGLTGSVFAGSVGLTQGLKQFGALDDGPVSRAQPHAQFTQVSLTLSYVRPLFGLGRQDPKTGQWSEGIVRFQTLFSGSYAPHALYGTEKVQIGGPFTVRGFDDQSLSGDVGGFARNELVYQFPRDTVGKRSDLTVYGAIDGGLIVTDYADGSAEKGLVGAAIGMRLSYRMLRAEARVEKAIVSPSFFERPGAILRFSASFLM